MFESLVSGLLNRLLGDYVEGLNRAQLQVAVWQGNVELENLAFRRDALHRLSVPLAIEAGSIAKLTIEIPWSALTSKPVKITMVGLSILAVAQPAAEYDAAAEAEKERARKARALDDQRSSTEDIDGEADIPTEGRASLLEQIVNNLQLIIEDVDIRYRDAQSLPGRSVQAGLRLRHVRVVPTDSAWTPAFNSRSERVAFRVLDVSDLTLYWVEEGRPGGRGGDAAAAAPAAIKTNMVEPISARARLRRVNSEANHTVASTGPRVKLEVEVSDVAFKITSHQLEHALAMQSFIAAYSARTAEYGRRFELWRWHRPHERPQACRSAAAWWRYASLAAVAHTRQGDSRSVLRWKAIAHRRDARHRYVDLWVKHKTTVPRKKDAAGTLKELESHLSLFDIMQFRELAKARIEDDPRLLKLAQSAQLANERQSWGQWAGSYLAILPQRPVEASAASPGRDPTTPVHGISSSCGASGRPASDIEATLVFASGSLLLTESVATIGGERKPENAVCHADFARLDVTLSTAYRLSAMECSVSLRELTVHDVVNPKTQFRHLLRKKRAPEEAAVPKLAGAHNSILKEYALFDATVSYSHAVAEPEFAVKVTSRPLEVVYNAVAMNKLAGFFGAVFKNKGSNAGSSELHVGAPAEQADGGQNDDNNVASMFAGLSKVRLDLDLSAPEILVPQDFDRASSRLVVLDLGRLRIVSRKDNEARDERDERGGSSRNTNSEGEDDEFLTPYSTPDEESDDDMAAQESVVHDLAGAAARLGGVIGDIEPDPPPSSRRHGAFDISLSRIQVLAMRANMDWKGALTASASDHSVLEPLSIHCSLECFGPPPCEDDAVSRRSPLIRLATVLPTLALDLSEEKIRSLLLCRGEGATAEGAPSTLGDDYLHPPLSVDNGGASVLAADGVESSFLQVVPSTDSIRTMDLEVSLEVNDMTVQLNAGDSTDAMPLVYVQIHQVSSSVTQSGGAINASFTVEAVDMVDQFLDFQGFLPQYQNIISASGDEKTAFIHMLYSHKMGTGDDAATSPHEVALHMSTLEINVNQITCAALLDFFHGAFEGSSNDYDQEAALPVDQPTFIDEGNSTSFTFDASEVNLTLLTKLHPFAAFTLKGVQAHYESLPTHSVLSGTLGSVALTDLTTGGALCRPCFTTNLAEEALSFSLVQHRQQSLVQEPPAAGATARGESVTPAGAPYVFDRDFTLKLASARILYTERFFSKLRMYVGDFREFQEFFYLARQTAATLIMEDQDSTSVTRMDILIDRPVLIIPENSFSTHAFEANLGRMRVRNSVEATPPVQECHADFVTSEAGMGINAITIDIDDMNLFSSSEVVSTSFNGPRDPVNERGMQRIVQSCSLEVRWDMRLDSQRVDLPLNKMVVTVSDVDILLTKAQYGLLLKVLNENLGSEPWMKFGLHERGLSRGIETPSRLRPTDLHAGRSQMSDLESKFYDQVPSSKQHSTGNATAEESVPDPAVGEAACEDVRVLPQFYGSVNFRNVRLEIFFDETDGGEPEPLARLDLLDTTISYASSSNGRPDGHRSQVTWESKAIRVHDTQHLCGGVKNAFTEVLKPIVGDNDASAPSLLLVTIKSAAKEATVTVLLNQTRVIVALPWVVKMWDWLLKWPPTDVITQYYVDHNCGLEYRPSSSLALKEEDVSEKIARPRVWKYKVSITDPEFVVVENRSRLNTHAVVMKFCAVLSYRHTPDGALLDDILADIKSAGKSNKTRVHMSAALEGLEIYSCQLQKESSTALSIVDPCNGQVELTCELETTGAELTEIELDFVSPNSGGEPNRFEDGSLEMRLSYSDFQLFASILQSLNTEKEALVRTSAHKDGDENEYEKRLDMLTRVMGYSFVDSARALSYFHGSQVRAAIWLCRNRNPAMHGDSLSDHEAIVNNGEKVHFLVQCGYHETDATHALDVCNGDVRRGLVWLLVRGPDSVPSGLNITNISLVGAQIAAEDAAAPAAAAPAPETTTLVPTISIGDVGSLLESTDHGSTDEISSADPSAAAALPIERAHDPKQPAVSRPPFVRKLNLRADSTRLCIIDDCAGNDSPLLEFKTGNVFVCMQRSFDGDSVHTDARMQGSLRCNYFNGALSAWEPCLEPWQVTLNGQVNEGPTRSIYLTANALSRLELNVTSALVASLSATLRSWSKHSQDLHAGVVTERRKFVPYSLTNQTGDPVQIRTLTTGMEKGDVLEVENGKEVSIDLNDSRRQYRRGSHHRVVHKIALQVAGWKEVAPPLPVNRAGTFVRFVEPISPGRQAARIVIEILVCESRRTIVVRSGLVVKSELDVAVRLSLGRTDGTVTPVDEALEPRGTFYVPLRESSSIIFFSPGPSFSLCKPGVQWQAADQPQILFPSTCGPVKPSVGDRAKAARPFSCHISIAQEPFPQAPVHCPGHTITLYPPFVIESMLPCPLEFHVVGTNIGEELSAGNKQGIYEIGFNDAPQFTFMLPGYEWTEPVQLNVRMRAKATEQRLRFVDKMRRVLTVQIRIEPPTRSNGAWLLCLYASYWMINNTGLPLTYRQAARSTLAAGQNNDIVDLCSPRPLLFSCDDETLSSVNKCQVRIGNSRWSQPVAMDVVGMALTVQVDRGEVAPARTYPLVHDLGVDVKYAHGRFSRTKVITWMPRFVVVNATDAIVEIKVADEAKIKALAPRCSEPYYFEGSQARDVCLRLVQDLRGWCWSSVFRFDHVGTFHAKMMDSESARVKLIAVEIKIVGAAYQAIFSDADAMPPFRIENRSLVSVQYHQAGVVAFSEIQPQSTIVYAWDDLKKEQDLTLCVKDVAYTYAQAYDLQQAGAGRQLSYPQDRIIIGPSGLVLGGIADPDNPLQPVSLLLSTRRSQDAMQLWSWSKSGRLRNKAGYILELARTRSTSMWCVQLRKPKSGEKAHRSTQHWRFVDGRLWCTGPTRGDDLVLTCGCPPDRSARVGDKFVAVAASDDHQKSHLTMHTLPPGSGKLNITIVPDGPTRVIRIDDVEQHSKDQPSPRASPKLRTLYSPQKVESSSSSSQRLESPWDLHLGLDMAKGIGISVIDSEELAYVVWDTVAFHAFLYLYSLICALPPLRYLSAEGIKINLEDAHQALSFEFLLTDVQIDNQLADDDHHSNALCTLPDLEPRASPAVSIRVIRSRDSSGAADVYRLFEVEVKPLSLRIDELLLLRLVRLARQSRVSAEATGDGLDMSRTDLALSIRHEIDDESVVLGAATSATYFELIDLKKVKVRVSVLTCVDLDHDLAILKRELGLRSLMKFEDAVLLVNDFRQERPFVNVALLWRLIIAHYRHEVLRQAYKIVGSIDLIGNPIGIVQGVSRGVKALVKESSSGKPVSGGMSLARHITHGLADSAAKLSGSVAEGVGRATMDREYQAARERRRAKAKDAAGHLANAGTSLFRGIVTGIAGVVEQPIRGAQKDGVEGFFKGGAKGIVGMVAKPLAGVFDMLSETSAAVRQSSSRAVHRATRVRLPRVIGPDRTLHPYSIADAEGQRLMLTLNKRNREERFVNCTYLMGPARDGGLDTESAALITSERVIFLGHVPTGGTGVISEVWFCGLYSYKAIRRNRVVNVEFQVSEEMLSEIRDRLELHPQTACTIAEPWWGRKTTWVAVPCGTEEVAKTVLRHIEWAMAFFTERSHEAR